MPEQYPYLPRFDTYLPPYVPGQSAKPTPSLPAAVPATGTGDWFTSGVMSGFHGAVSEGARALQAAAQLAGATDAAQSISDFAERAHARGQEYARPDLEESPWSLPGIGYQIARAVPVGAAAVGAGLLATATAPEAAAGAVAATGLRALLGGASARGLGAASLAMYPTSAGANVQRQIDETGELTTPGKALAYGVPEAILQGYLPGRLEAFFGKGFLPGLKHAAITQGGAMGATEFLTQELGDPNRGMADRAAAIGHSALTGAALGTIMHGTFSGFRSLVGKPAADIKTEDLAGATDQALAPADQSRLADRALNRQPRAPLSEPPPPVIQAGPPLHDMSPMELAARFNKAQENLRVTPQDPEALDTFRLLGQEYTRRVAEMEPAPATPEPPRQLTYQPEMRGPLHEVPAGEIAGQIDVLTPPRTQAEAEKLRQLVQEQQRRAAEAAEVAAAAPGPQKLLPPPSIKEGPPLQEMSPANLWARLSYVRGHLAVNPDDVRAQRASELVGQEFSRRVEATAKEAPEPVAPVAPAVAEPVPAAPAGGIPFMITGQMKADLMARGVTPEQITNMTPEQAHANLSAAPAAAPVAPVAEAPAAAPVAPVAEAPAAPVIDFTKRITSQTSFDRAWAQVEAAPIEAQAAEQQRLIDLIAARGDKPLTAPLRKWASKFDILDEKGKLKEEFTQERPPEAPPGVTEEAPPVAPVAAVPEIPKAAAPLEEGIPDFLRRVPKETPAEPLVPPPPPPASTAPIKTPEDRAAALSGLQDHIAGLPDSEIKNQYAVEAKTLSDLLPNVEKNPGAALPLNDRLTRLRNQVEAETQPPADQVAAPDLTPSSRAEAVPAPTGDLGKRLEDARNALSTLAKVLGKRPEVVAAIEQHEKWLVDITKGDDDAGAMRAALAKDPEALAAAEAPGAADLGGITQLSVPQKKLMAAYLSAQEKVLQEMRALSNSRARVIASRDGLPVTQLDADVTDLHQRGVKLTDVADHIIQHIADPEQVEIVSKLRAALGDEKTVFRDGVTDKEGEYFPKQKISALYNAANATTTAIHEMAHAVMHRAMEGNSAAARAMRGIYDQLKDKGDHAGITDAHEMVSEAMANPVYRDFLKSQIVKGTSLWDRFIDTMRSVIGLEPRLFNALDRIMSHGDDLMKEQKLYPNSEWMGRDSYASVTDKAIKTATVAADDGGRAVLEKVDNGLLNVKEWLRDKGLGWSNGFWLAGTRLYNELSSNLPEFVNTLKMEGPLRKAIGRAGTIADRQARALSPEGQQIEKELMAASTSYGFHPERELRDYEEIHANPVRVQQFNFVKDLWNQAAKISGVREAYNTWRSVMSTRGHMTAVLNLQSVEREITGLNAPDSFKGYGMRDDLHENPKSADDHWQKVLNDKIKVDTEFRKTLSESKVKVDAALAAIEFKKDYPKELVERSKELGSQIDRLGAALKIATDEQARMFKEPYFHLGRKGDYFGTGKLVTTPGAIDPETGKPGKPIVDQAVLSKLQDHLEKSGINDVAIMAGNQHGTFYTRVESPAQLGALSKVLEDAQKAGLLSEEPLVHGKILDPHIFNRVASQATRDIIARMRENRPIAPERGDQEALDKAHYAQIRDLQRTLLGMTPETSMGRLTAHRQNVQGFSKDMFRSQGYAADVSAFSIARQALMHEVSGFEAGMLKDLEQVNSTPIDLNTKLGLTAVVEELMQSQRTRQTFVPRDWKEAARSFTNFLHIGMSPAYVPMQLSQLAMTGVPELAKTHGYGASTAAVTQAIGPAMQVLNAIRKSQDGLTGGITRAALEKQELDPALINTVMGAELRGTLGTYTESVASRSPLLEGVTDSPSVHKISSTVAKLSNVLGTYADLAPRLVMAIAADKRYTAKPHPEMTREQYIDHVVDQSQGYYGGALGARQMGKGGALGPITPVTMQFMSWPIHMANKMYHEVYDSVKGENAQVRAEARTWLGGHLAATTMLAGTLGLPLVSVMASAYDWFMKTTTGRDDHDITASYRTFLASTFGKDMGEIIARGLPRAAGVDFANWGEGEIVPGSASLKIFTEKRKWEDVERDWFKSMGGPALDQLFQLGLAGRDITNGDYLQGLGRFFPGAVTGPMKAYQLGRDGFVDSHGQKLPMSSPNALDYALTAMGLKPAKQAEYQEVAREVSGLRAMREASSANISQHLRQAWTRGDQGDFNAWMAEAHQWQLRHPGLVPPHASFGAALNNHMRQLAQARGTGLPIGVTPQDIGTRGQFQYGNFPVQ